MYFQIQLVHPFQHKVRIESSPASEGEFDSVRIEECTSPSFATVTFLVPHGKGEALAEALRKAIMP